MALAPLDWLALFMMALAALSFASLMKGTTAPYGRYCREGWGPLLDARVAWVTQELPALLVPLEVARRAGAWGSFAAHPLRPRSVLAAAFVAHYAHRALLFPLLIRGGKPTALSTWLMALVYCIINGYMQGAFLVHHLQPDTPWRVHHVVGVALWAAGWLGNLHADHVLRNLRGPGETGYKVPHGGLFELVSAANYAGEILEWTGYAIAGWGLPAAAFAVFTFSNLGPRGWQHHQWYKSKFPAYPRGRRAVLPWVW